MDVLANWLESSGFKSRFFLTPKCKAPWGFLEQKHPEEIVFHYVVRGSCHVGMKKNKKMEYEQMFPGDFVIFPCGDGHELVDAPGSEVVDTRTISRPQTVDEMESIVCGGKGTQTDLICGAFTFSRPGYEILQEPLPSKILLRGTDPNRNPGIIHCLNMIASEFFVWRPGWELVVSNLLTALFMLVVRDEQSKLEVGASGLLAALKNDQLTQVLEQIHAHPHRGWDVDTLAKMAGLSRSAFSEKFSAYFHMGPAKYVNQIRLRNAVQLLLDSDRSVKEISGSIGFSRPEIFIRNFTQEYSMTPSEYRKQHAVVESAN